MFRGSVFNEFAFVRTDRPDLDITVLFDETQNFSFDEFMTQIDEAFQDYAVLFAYYAPELHGSNVPSQTIRNNSRGIRLDFDLIPVKISLTKWLKRHLETNVREYEKQTFSQAEIIYDKHGYGLDFKEIMSGKKGKDYVFQDKT